MRTQKKSSKIVELRRNVLEFVWFVIYVNSYVFIVDKEGEVIL